MSFVLSEERERPASARQTKKECLLCDETLIQGRLYSRLFEAYGQTARRNHLARGAGRACELLLTETGIVLDEAGLQRHFRYHSRHQPPPSRPLSRKRTADLRSSLSERQMEMLRMTMRLGATSVLQLRRTLYEDEQTSVAVAQAACSRELHALIYEHLVFRHNAPPERVQLKKSEQIACHGLLGPGRHCTGIASEDGGLIPEVIQDGAAIDIHRVRRQLDINELIISLLLRARSQQIDLGGDTADIGINPINWFGSRQSEIWFENPISRLRQRVAPDGLAAVSLLCPRRGVDTLLPFFYLWDPGWKRADDLVEDLALYGPLRLSHATQARFPNLGSETPPILVIHRDARRLEEIAALLQRRCAGLGDHERPAIISTDRASLLAAGWDQPITDDPLDRDAPRRSLLGAIARALPGARQGLLAASAVIASDYSAAARPPRRQRS